MAIEIGKLLGTDKLVGTDDEDLLIALGAKTTLSAVSNGKGGTMLTHAQGTLELLGVDPGSVVADWFV